MIVAINTKIIANLSTKENAQNKLLIENDIVKMLNMITT